MSSCFVSNKADGKDDWPSKKTFSLRQVIEFEVEGVYVVKCVVSGMKCFHYMACPLKQNGFPCGKKLDDDHYCAKCDHKARNPKDAMFLKLDMEEPEDREVQQSVTMFQAQAEKFLGRTVKQLLEMDKDERERLISAKTGTKLMLKLNVKENKNDNFEETMDWRVVKYKFMDEEVEGENEEIAKNKRKSEDVKTESVVSKKPKKNEN